MTLATNGDFDQTLELSEELLTAAASATLGVDSKPEDLPSGLGVTGSVKPAPDIARIWFRTRPAQPWASQSGFGNLTRNTNDVITLALRVDVHIDLKTVRMVVNNKAQTVDVTTDSQYAPIRSIDFPAFVEVTDHVEVQTLDVTTDREAPGVTTRVPCVVIDFNRKTGLGRDWPRVDIRIKNADLQGNAAVQLMMAAAVVDAGGSGAAGDAALTGLHDTLTTIIPVKVTELVQSMTTWQLESPADSGKALLYASLETPTPVRLGVKTLAASLFIGIDYLAQRGRTQNVTLSTLRGRGARLDDFAVTVSNRWLLRGIIRGALARMFGRAGPPLAPLSPTDFVSAEFCVLKSPVSGSSFGGGVTLESLFAFINSTSQLEMVLEISKEDPPGITTHAVLDLQFSFTVKRSVAGAKQTLLLSTTLDNPDTAIKAKKVDVAWWWYLVGFANPAQPHLGALLAPLLGPAGIGLLDAGLDDVAAGKLNDALKSVSGPSQDNAVPLPVTLVAPAVELNDPDAPPMATPLGRLFAMPSITGGPDLTNVLRGHDLYLGARFAGLPDPLVVRFIIPDSEDPGRRLDGIGGRLAGGSEWRLPIDDAIALVDAGHRVIAKGRRGRAARVIKAIDKKSKVPYLRTERDDLGVNNLTNLPKRIPAAGSLGPTP